MDDGGGGNRGDCDGRGDASDGGLLCVLGGLAWSARGLVAEERGSRLPISPDDSPSSPWTLDFTSGFTSVCDKKQYISGRLLES